MINEYNTIADMKAASTTSMSNGQAAYVKGYFAPGDGGGGMFLLNKTDTQTDNKGVIIAPNTTTGRWIRQYDGYMNVEFFGVQKGWDFYTTTDPLFSNSDRIQLMIDYASARNTISAGNGKGNDVTIFFPNGGYFIDKPIILKDEVHMLGSSGTILTNNNYGYDYMFKLGKGAITKFRMEEFIVNPNGNPFGNPGEDVNTSGGFHLKAQLTDQNTAGGLWNAVFRNIIVMNTNGIGIYLEGGEVESNGFQPNQFMVFDNVRVVRNRASNPALKLTGENANYTFLNCEFRNTQGLTLGGSIIDIKSASSSQQKIGSNAIHFINSGFGGYSQYGAVIENSTCVSFDTCFFEGLDTSFSIKDSKEIQIMNSRFANAAGAGSLPSTYSTTGNVGTAIVVENSVVNIWNNYLAVSAASYPALDDQYFIIGNGNNNVINARNNGFSVAELSKTYGIMQTTTVDSNASANDTTHGTLHIAGKKLVFVTVPGLPGISVSKIDSDIAAGETVFIRANNGPIIFYPMNATSETSGRNIYLNGRSSLTLSNGQAATFIKIDNIVGDEKCSYQLVSIAN